MKRIFYTTIFLVTAISLSFAGNPDRQGEAGAGELLLNPWARSAGLHTMGTSFVSGVESLRLNPAGIGRISGKEIHVGNTRLYEGSTLMLNSVGYAQKSGKNGAFAFSIMQVDFGDIPITTENQPEGTGGTFSPGFINMGLGYAYTYENKISVGMTVRAISETLPDLSAFGFAIDAGIQYVSGDEDNFKLGISLRNVGSSMTFKGEGLATQVSSPETELDFIAKFDTRPQGFELPSVLNIGMSYDFYIAEKIYLRTLANFTSNAFSRDQIGGGVELNFKNLVTIRGGYKHEMGSAGTAQENIYTGLAGGISVNVPLSKESSSRLGIDYAYRTTSPFRGTHNIGLRFSF